MTEFKKGFLVGAGVLVAVVAVGFASGLVRKL